MERKTILVTGIGGNVGQGILRNIVSLKKDIRIIGTNTVHFTAGNYLVDAFYSVPFSYEESFPRIMKQIVENEKVDLIIPSTDYESFYLSANQNQFSCKIACMNEFATETYLDKYKTWLVHHQYNIPFAKTVLPSEYEQPFKMAIAKPRKGRGSRGLIKNVKDVSNLQDEEYLIQEQVEGLEITTAVYNRYADGQFHGLITMERSLDNGTTTFCKVNKQYDVALEEIAKKMSTQLNLRGSFNIQSIITANNEIVPFEINCRISGTNSIRSNFGFKDVEYTIEELLYERMPQPVKVIDGIAHRILVDVIYPLNSPTQVLKENNTDNFIIF